MSKENSNSAKQKRHVDNLCKREVLTTRKKKAGPNKVTNKKAEQR